MGANQFTPASGDGACQQITLSASGTYKLAQPVNGAISTWIIQIKGSAPAGTFIGKVSVTGSGLTGADLKDAPYYNQATPETLVAAGTAIGGADGIFKFPCDGCDLYLVYTSSAGSMAVHAYPVIG